MLTQRTLSLQELRHKTLEEVLQSVLTRQETLTVRFPSGTEVVIQPKPSLKPLPVLEGFVPEGWKEAIYNER